MPDVAVLEEYRRKRDFAVTPEPAGGAAGAHEALTFVIQKHHASRMHWDFRMELDGVLLSWAVPKGPSLDPADKRLAMRVEDHPIEYGSFEGVIPKGEYGGGTVMLWDRGTWEPDHGDPRQHLAEGHLKFDLYGERLRGRWMLVRTKGYGGSDKDSWLLFKERDEEVRPKSEVDAADEWMTSVATGRSM
ncbi:MAG: DNA polymerase ligase N-terminal domain-containing protein, partial [Coriobacteriia bacterium]